MPYRIAIFLLPFLMLAPLCRADEPLVLTITGAQTAGIDGRAWDTPFPGAMTVDAAQRAVLLRFPGAAAQIAAKLQDGFVLQRAEVVFGYAGYEQSPDGYILRTGGMVPRLQADPPQWHLLAWVLRRPWTAERALAPTFNAFINGAGYWTKFGADD